MRVNIYPKKSEDEIFADIRRRHMRYLYVGFLKLFPASVHRSEVTRLSQDYFALIVGTKGVLGYDILTSHCNFNGDKKIYKTSSDDTGFVRNKSIMVMSEETNRPEEAVSVDLMLGGRHFGNAAIGNIEVPDDFYFYRGGLLVKKWDIFVCPRRKS